MVARRSALRRLFQLLHGAKRTQAIENIRNQAKEIESGKVGETPLKIAAIVQQLAKNPGNELLREILSSISAMRLELAAISNNVNSSPFTNVYQEVAGRLVPMSSLGSVLSGVPVTVRQKPGTTAQPTPKKEKPEKE